MCRFSNKDDMEIGYYTDLFEIFDSFPNIRLKL